MRDRTQKTIAELKKKLSEVKDKHGDLGTRNVKLEEDFQKRLEIKAKLEVDITNLYTKQAELEEKEISGITKLRELQTNIQTLVGTATILVADIARLQEIRMKLEANTHQPWSFSLQQNEFLISQQHATYQILLTQSQHVSGTKQMEEWMQPDCVDLAPSRFSQTVDALSSTAETWEYGSGAPSDFGRSQTD